MMRETVSAAAGECTVENTRWPVSAAVSAVSMVSGRAFREQDHVRVLAQRGTHGVGEAVGVDADFALVITERFSANRNSIGSSMVRM